ncbi:MAG: hypothetical protein NUV56_01210 [Candidatus Uhrbacteria bacterium]|nr:hypothetical protein [Candidatus Uhrbacteria bacterium]
MRSGILVLHFIFDVNESSFSGPVLVTAKVEFMRFKLSELALIKFGYYLGLMQPNFEKFVEDLGCDHPSSIDESLWDQIREMRKVGGKKYFQVLTQQIIFDQPA